MAEVLKKSAIKDTDLSTAPLFTKRAISEELENILFEPVKVLDHGFIRVIDYMGNDQAITQAARVSYGKGTKTVQSDKALIRYLLKHDHTSPFEMCEIKLHIKAPIFVARQWVRHRTANINEYSGRYSLMSEDCYIPEKNHIMAQSANNKQGRGEVLPEPYNSAAYQKIKNLSEEAFKVYSELLAANEENSGLARELARIILPLNNYTEFYWKIDLHNLLHFLRLRCHPHAQYEIRVYAEIMMNLVKKWVPITAEAFVDYKQDSVVLSKEATSLIKELLHQSRDKVTTNNKNKLSSRELKELADIFELTNLTDK